ncbi:MAG: hypothetical protein ACP5N2_01470 [Candidatus Nanoarchaeia archaeon]
MNTYQNLKENIAHYAMPIVLASSLVISNSSCKQDSSYIMNNEATKELILKKHREKEKYLDVLKIIAEEHTTTARKIFDKGLENKILDSTTMARTYNNFKEAENTYSTIRKIARENKIEKYRDIQMSKNDETLSKRISKTLYGLDFGKSELEKDLEKNGLKIDVYNHLSIGEALLGIGIALGIWRLSKL